VPTAALPSPSKRSAYARYSVRRTAAVRRRRSPMQAACTGAWVMHGAERQRGQACQPSIRRNLVGCARTPRKDRQGETLVHPWRMAPEALPPGGGLLLPRLHKPGVVRTRHHTVCDFLPGDRGTGRTADEFECRASVIRTDLIDTCGLGAGEPAGPNPGGVSLQELSGLNITPGREGTGEEECDDCHGYAHSDHFPTPCRTPGGAGHP
jgi:hypothetical protein